MTVKILKRTHHYKTFYKISGLQQHNKIITATLSEPQRPCYPPLFLLVKHKPCICNYLNFKKLEQKDVYYVVASPYFVCKHLASEETRCWSFSRIS